MAKLKLPLLSILLMLLTQVCGAQTSYTLRYRIVDSASNVSQPYLKTEFPSQVLAAEYLKELPATLQLAGFISASVDSMRLDSAGGDVFLFLGEKYKWKQLHTRQADDSLLRVMGWTGKTFNGISLDFPLLLDWQKRLLNRLEENGHPFARIYLDSVQLRNGEIEALLGIHRGPLYRIDSIRVYGDARVSNEFLQRYLSIPNGSIYNKKKLLDISRKLALLSFLQEEKPSDLSVLSTGSVLNLYLKSKRNSQVSLLAGLLPNSDAAAERKFQFTVDANILLKNSLGAGETIGLTWQKLQPQAQRLNFLYEHPYVFHSPVGLGFQFNMYRQDSMYLNIDMRVSGNYGVSETQQGALFIERRSTIVNAINEPQVIFTRSLPQEADVSSTNLGVSYLYNNTNYRFNPQKGFDVQFTVSAGNKMIKKNNAILDLKDPSDPSFKFASLYDTVKLKTYQFRLVTQTARYFAVGKQGSFKTGIQAGLYSSGNLFRNELFQIGGYRLLRGFDEGSQYVSQYAVGTLEYRYLIGQNSNFFVFADGGWARHLQKNNHNYLSSGLGISFETKAGIFNLAWALGKRDDTEFNLRQSKVHLGFVNYF